MWVWILTLPFASCANTFLNRWFTSQFLSFLIYQVDIVIWIENWVNQNICNVLRKGLDIKISVAYTVICIYLWKEFCNFTGLYNIGLKGTFETRVEIKQEHGQMAWFWALVVIFRSDFICEMDMLITSLLTVRVFWRLDRKIHSYHTVNGKALLLACLLLLFTNEVTEVHCVTLGKLLFL